MTEEYRKTRIASSALRETNDCGVVATALAANIPYWQALQALYKKGRRPKKGTPIRAIQSVLREHALEMVEIDRFGLIPAKWKWQNYVTCPQIKNNRLAENKTIRTLSRCLPQKGILLVLVSTGSERCHIFCAKAGQVHDWSQNRCFRILRIWQVVSNQHPVVKSWKEKHGIN